MREFKNYTFLGHLSRMRFDWGISESIMAASAVASAGSSAAQISMGGKMNQRAAREARRTREWQTQERLAQQEWQLEQYNRQLADQRALRDEENAYNDPAAQRDRMVAAGYSPLGNVQPMESAEVGTPNPSASSAPGGAVAQTFNPQLGDFGGSNMLALGQQILLKEKQDAEIGKLTEETNSIAFQRMRDGLQFGKQFELMGVNIDLQKAQLHLTQQEAANAAKDLLVKEQTIKTMVMEAAKSGAEIRYKDTLRALESMKVTADCKLLAQKMLSELQNTRYLGALAGGQINENRKQWQENHAGTKVNGRYQDFWSQKLNNETSFGFWQKEEMKRVHRYNTVQEWSPEVTNIRHGLQTVSEAVGVVQQCVDIAKMQSYRSYLNYKAHQQLSSSPNPY